MEYALNFNLLHAERFEVVEKVLLLIGSRLSVSELRKPFFSRLAQDLNVLTEKVESQWDDLSDEERDILRNLAYTVLNPQSNGQPSGKVTWKSWRSKWSARVRLFIALWSGQKDAILAVVTSGLRLVDAITEAIEREEAPMTAQFLDKLLEDAESNPSQLVPYTAQMDARLEQLLDGVELD